MKLRWTIIFGISIVFFAFVIWFRPFGPSISDMAPKGTALVASFSNPAKTMEILDRAGVFTQLVKFYNVKPLPSQVLLALMADRLLIIFGKNLTTNDKFMVFALDYGPAARLFRLKESGQMHRVGELLCFSEMACAKKFGRYMLAGSQVALESYASALKSGTIDDPAEVENLKSLASRGEFALFLASFDPLVEGLKKAGDLDLSLLVDAKSFAGMGVFGNLDETGLQITGEIFSRTDKSVFKLDSTQKLPLLEPKKSAISLSFDIDSPKLFEKLFAKTLNVRTEGTDVGAKLKQLVLQSFVGTLSGKLCASLAKGGTAWALELARPDEMRSYLALLKRSVTGESESDTERLELTFQNSTRAVISEGKWLVIGSDKGAAETLLEQITKADVGGPYAFWASFWTPGVATDGPTMVYIYGPKSNLIKGYVPKAMIPRLPLAREILHAKRYKLAAHIIYYGVLALSIGLVVTSGYKLFKLSRPHRERRPSNKKA